MFVRAFSFSSKIKQQKLDRSRPPSPWTNDLVNEGAAVFVVQFAGTVDLTHADDVDLSYKKKLLQFVHQCQLEHRLAKRLNEKSIVQLHLTTEQIRLADIHQKTTLSIPSHNVIACYYVEYLRDHIVAMKFVATKDQYSTVQLAVFLFHNRDEADELCSSMEYCFRAVYIANEGNSDISNKLAALTVSLSSTQQLRNSFRSTTSSTPSTIRSLSLSSTSSARVVTPETPMVVTSSDNYSAPRRRHRRPRPRDDDNTTGKSSSKSIVQIIQNYLINLQLELKTDELAEFGKLLTEWQSGKLDTRAFVKQTARLYGDSRRNLLDGLHDFLPADQQTWFLGFLKDVKSTSIALLSSMDSIQDIDLL